MDLTGKVAIVTGGGPGPGPARAGEPPAGGAMVVVDDVDPDAADADPR